MSVSVCLFVCRQAYLPNTRPIFTKFLCTLPMAVGRSSSDGVAIYYVLPVLWMTSYLRISQGSSGAARGEGGKLPPYEWTSKNYVICVCFHCHGTSSYHTTNTLQGRRAKSHVDTQTIQPDWGTSYSRPPIDPYLNSPLLQNPGGATARQLSVAAQLMEAQPTCSLGLGYKRRVGIPVAVQWTHRPTFLAPQFGSTRLQWAC